LASSANPYWKTIEREIDEENAEEKFDENAQDNSARDSNEIDGDNDVIRRDLGKKLSKDQLRSFLSGQR